MFDVKMSLNRLSIENFVQDVCNQISRKIAQKTAAIVDFNLNQSLYGYVVKFDLEREKQKSNFTMRFNPGTHTLGLVGIEMGTVFQQAFGITQDDIKAILKETVADRLPRHRDRLVTIDLQF